MNSRRSARIQQSETVPNDKNSKKNSSSITTHLSSDQKDANTYSAVSTEQQALDAATQLASFANMNVDYDPTEGAGGLSISSFDSIDSDRSGLSTKGYPSFQGKLNPIT